MRTKSWAPATNKTGVIPKIGVRTHEMMICRVLARHLTWNAAKSLQSCPTLCDPIDGSPSGSSVRGIFQASRRGLAPRGILECNPEIPAFPG